MKESARAARDEIAHNRSVAALEKLAGEDDPKVQELKDLRTRRVPPEVATMMEREIMADILEGLAGSRVVQDETDLEDLSGIEEALAGVLNEAGYLTKDQLRQATDEELLAIKGIGPATVEKIRASL